MIPEWLKPLLAHLKDLGVDPWGPLLFLFTVLSGLIAWLKRRGKVEREPHPRASLKNQGLSTVHAHIFNSANGAFSVGQQIGGTGNTVSVHQNDPATTELARKFLDAIQQKDMSLVAKDQRILELSLENQKLRMEAALTVSIEASKPNPTVLAVSAKKEMLQGNLEAASRLLTQLAQDAAEKTTPDLVQAAHYARQSAALWIGRDTRKAIAAFERVLKFHGSDIPTLIALVDLYVVMGDSPKAFGHAKSALAIAEARCKQQPQNSDWTYYLSVILMWIGGIQLAQGKPADALASYRTGLEAMTKLVKSDSSNTHWLRELSVSHDRIGRLLETRGESVDARKSHEAAMEIAKNLADTDETNSLWQYGLSVCYEKTADIEAKEGRFRDALRFQLVALDIRRRITNVENANKQWQHSLAVGYINLGDYQYKVKEPLAAANSLQAGRQILEELVNTDPTNANWKHDLAAANGFIGNHWAWEGKFQKALVSYSLELDIAIGLVKLDEKNVLWQHHLAKGYNSVGTTQSSLGLESDALEYLLKAREIFKRLSELDSANTEYLADLVRSSWSISCLAPAAVSYSQASTLLRDAQLILARLAAERALTSRERGWNQGIAERLSGWQRIANRQKSGA